MTSAEASSEEASHPAGSNPEVDETRKSSIVKQQGQYQKVKFLGEGAFGEVWLARAKGGPENRSDGDEKNPSLVAIKYISAPDRKSRCYVQREVKILSEVDHPHAIRLVEFVKDSTGKNMQVILPYVDGPTLEDLLKAGGALSLPLARLVSRHLVAVVSYLHTRAVIHRDLKPDNIIITGASLHDDDIWSFSAGAAERVDKKWKLVLIDFGLSRALNPDEVDQDANLVKSTNAEEQSGKVTRRFTLDRKISSLPRSKTKMDVGTSLSRQGSVSAKTVKRLSAVGTKFYAAPEIEKNHRKKSSRKLVGKSNQNEPLSACIADYGMVADSFSLGSVLRETLTGVPPNMDINEYIGKHTNIFATVARSLSKLSLGCRGGKQATGEKERVRKFRSNDEVPTDAVRLIRGLIAPNPKNRTTVRSAQVDPWIAGADDEPEYEIPQGDVPCAPGERIVFLSCALEK